nr:hypothetical protein [Bacteroidota bacterium]
MKSPSHRILYGGILLLYSLMVFLLMLQPLSTFSQEKQDFRKIDSLTYSLYQQGKWDKLITVGEKALGQGLDYYYLQIRVGIAWYEKQNYRRAIPHFEEALKFNLVDQTVLEYLYYSYLLSGRNYDMRRIV